MAKVPNSSGGPKFPIPKKTQRKPKVALTAGQKRLMAPVAAPPVELIPIPEPAPEPIPEPAPIATQGDEGETNRETGDGTAERAGRRQRTQPIGFPARKKRPKKPRVPVFRERGPQIAKRKAPPAWGELPEGAEPGEGASLPVDPQPRVPRPWGNSAPRPRPFGATHVPTEANRFLVSIASACGFTKDQTAYMVGIHASTLVRHYSEEMEHGALRITAKIAANLAVIAASPTHSKSVEAAKFWLKARARWTDGPELSLSVSGAGKDGAPPTSFTINIGELGGPGSGTASDGPVIEG